MTNRKLTIFSWSMYDFANTIFSMNIISLYFVLWVTVNMKGEDILYSGVLSGSMLLAAISSPILGAVSDKLRKRMPFLILFTLICCIFTALLGLINSLFLGLLFFAVANFCYQVAAIFYNALLPQVSGEKQIGRVSGYGVSLGYCGAITGLLLVRPFVLQYGRQAAFIPTAGFFLLFSLPSFLFVKDQFVTPSKKHKQGFLYNELGKREKIGFQLMKPFKRLKAAFIDIKKSPVLFYFIISTFIAFNAINTIIVFMSVYTKKVIGFADKEINTFYIISTFFAIVGSFISGFVTDRLGSKPTLKGILLFWCISIFLALVTFNKSIFWFIGPLIGICLGATWTSARTLAVDLSPPHKLGEIFGFYGLAGKTASIIGPLIWGVTVWAAGSLGIIKYRIAVFVLLLFIITAYYFLCQVPRKGTELDS